MPPQKYTEARKRPRRLLLSTMLTNLWFAGLVLCMWPTNGGSLLPKRKEKKMDKLKSDRMEELEWQMEDALAAIKSVKTKGYWFKQYEKLLNLYQEEALRVAEALTA